MKYLNETLYIVITSITGLVEIMHTYLWYISLEVWSRINEHFLEKSMEITNDTVSIFNRYNWGSLHHERFQNRSRWYQEDVYIFEVLGRHQCAFTKTPTMQLTNIKIYFRITSHKTNITKITLETSKILQLRRYPVLHYFLYNY